MLAASGCDKNPDIAALIELREKQLQPLAKQLLAQWPETKTAYQSEEFVATAGDRKTRTKLVRETLSGTRISKVCVPKFVDHGELLQWLMLENLPGRFPFTAGVFAFKRDNEDPTRMFAGEGDAFRTNRRFKKLSEHAPAKRLSTAFDSVTLYGQDPHEQPDIYGKVGNAGVSICTTEDMQALYDGFDLCSDNTSVSMTINGPAPIILAFFFDTAFQQQIVKFEREHSRKPNSDEMGFLILVISESKISFHGDVCHGSQSLGALEPLNVVQVGDVLEVPVAERRLQGNVNSSRMIWLQPNARVAGLTDS